MTAQKQPSRLSEFFTSLRKKAEELRIVRSFERYSSVQAPLLAGGFAYTVVISFFAILTLVFSIAGWLLADNTAARMSLYRVVDESFPMILDLPNSPGIIDPDSLFKPANFSLPGIIAFIVLLAAARRVMVALKTTIRSVFGLAVTPGSWIRDQLRDIFAFLVIAVAVILSSFLSIMATRTGADLMRYLGFDGAFIAFGVYIIPILVGFTIDIFTFALIIRFHAGAHAPTKDFWQGCAMGAAASGVLRWAGSSIITASKNPLLVSVAAVATLLLLANLVGRVILLVSAWIANPPAPQPPHEILQKHAQESPNYVTLSAPHTLEWPHDPLTGALQNPPQ